MKIFLSAIASAALCALGTLSSSAQDDPPEKLAAAIPPAPEPGVPLNREQLEYAISFVQEHIDTRNNRITDIASEIVRLDTRIEQGIDSILGMLSGIKDSADSESRVSALKIRAMEGLHNTIEYYDRKRRALQEEERQRDPKISRDTITEDIKKFDARVEKRVEQILALAKTMPGYDVNLERLKTRESGGWWGGTYYTRNDEYYQNRREGARTQKTQKEIIEELQASIDRHDRIVRDIEETLKREITPQFREMLTAQLDRSASLIETRRHQIQELTMTAANPAGQQVGSQQARNMETLIDDMVKDLRRDFFNMFESYATLNSERQHIHALEQQIEGYKSQLADPK